MHCVILCMCSPIIKKNFAVAEVHPISCWELSYVTMPWLYLPCHLLYYQLPYICQGSNDEQKKQRFWVPGCEVSITFCSCVAISSSVFCPSGSLCTDWVSWGPGGVREGSVGIGEGKRWPFCSDWARAGCGDPDTLPGVGEGFCGTGKGVWGAGTTFEGCRRCLSLSASWASKACEHTTIMRNVFRRLYFS